MARQDIDIGVEGNDGTGDSIRESFRKTNENFTELYAVFGVEGSLSFTSLSDTPNTYDNNKILTTNATGNAVIFSSITSNDGTIGIDVISTPGEIDLSVTKIRIVNDNESPTLGQHLSAANFAIAGVQISSAAAQAINDQPGRSTSFTIDDLVITKGYADRRYVTSGLPIRVAPEPADTTGFIKVIDSYNGQSHLVFNSGHGYDSGANGTAFVFNSEDLDPNGLVSGNTYYIRYESDTELSLYDTKEKAQQESATQAAVDKLAISGTIDPRDTHTITDAGYDIELPGNFLADTAMPRRSVVRRQGDRMEGALILHDHPGDLAGSGTPNGLEDLQAATKYYVDNTAYSSPEVLYVSTIGDDTMQGVPFGKEGTADTYAFRSINAAAQRAAELINTAPEEPGPYFQTLSFGATPNTAGTPSTVISAGVENAVNIDTRSIIQNNKEYIIKEITGYLAFTYPDFSYNVDLCERDLGLILDAVSFDAARGNTANYLSRTAAERYYSSVSGRVAITSQLERTDDAFAIASELVQVVLQNQLYLPKTVTAIAKALPSTGSIITPAVVTTSTDHGLVSGNQVIFKDVSGMTQIEDEVLYVKVTSAGTFELFTDEALSNPYDNRTFTTFVNDGSAKIGLRYQDKLSQDTSVSPVSPIDSGYVAVTQNFSLIRNIIRNGVSAGADIAFGNRYLLSLTNSTAGILDQTDPDNVDALPGKVIVGKRSGAIGRIITFTQNTSATNFFLQPLEAREFEPGEELEMGNFVKAKQVTIRVESGIYEEDFPIKLTKNVSLKGDEFRRVIIRPKRRVSQSPFANTYFYRDRQFDGIELLTTGTPFINQTGELQGYFGYHYLSDNTKPVNVGLSVSNPGGYNTAARIIKLNKTFIQVEVAEYLDATYPTLFSSISRAKLEKDIGIIIESIIKDLQVGGREGVLESQGELFNGDLVPTPGTETEIEAAIDYISTLAADLLVGNTPSTIRGTVEVDLDGGTAEPEWAAGVTYVQGDFVKKTVGLNTFYYKALINHTSESSDEDTNVLSATYLKLTNTTRWKEVSSSVDVLGDLVDTVNFVFDTNYNPPKRNDADGVDVFLMDDATIVRNVTVQGHGGFMCVLDPTGQILTKSPYIQTASSFSRSRNAKAFSGGMFVDAFCGNIPMRIKGNSGNYTDSSGTVGLNAFTLFVESQDVNGQGQGLKLRLPELPAPFYFEGQRYQVNAISNYDSGTGRAVIYLDPNSNNGLGWNRVGADDIGDPGHDVNDVIQDIFLQTAGNRSILGNDYTQINDLGYGLVTTNGAFSEMVSMFTYYCHAAYYAANGSEIRSLNGSNGYGNFGLVAEGADPNEIPDEVTLLRNSVQPIKAFTYGGFTNAFDNSAITVYDFKEPPLSNSFISIDHGGSAGFLNYRISRVENLSDPNNNGNIGAGGAIVVSGIEAVNNSGITGSSPGGNSTSLNVPQKSTSGSGYGAEFTVTITSGVPSFTITNVGQGYSIGDTVTISGADIGGSNGTNDLTIPVSAVYGTSSGTYIDPPVTGTITGATATNPVVITSSSHGLANGDRITIDGVSGMTQLNGSSYYVGNVATNTFALYTNASGTFPVNGSAFTSYTSGGTWTKAGGIGNHVYRLSIQEVASNTDFFKSLQATVSNNTLIDYRHGENFLFSGVANPETITERPSTAINFDESDFTTYRSTGFTQKDDQNQDLGSDEIKVTFDSRFNNIILTVDLANTTEVDPDDISKTLGSTIGDTKIAVRHIDNLEIEERLLRDATDALNQTILLPGDAGYTGGMIFAYAGKVFQVIDYQPITSKAITNVTQANPAVVTSANHGLVNGTEIQIRGIGGMTDLNNNIFYVGNATTNTFTLYTDSGLSNSLDSTIYPAYTSGGIWFTSDSTWYIEVQDYQENATDWDITGTSLNNGIKTAFTTSRDLYLGIQRGTTAEITIAISLLRATGHDFTQIGTGGFNTSNYPNVLLGGALEAKAGAYSDSDDASKAQVWERRKGRVFFISSDQDGFFRVGKYFVVDQSTGSITFAGEVGISRAASLGFREGVTIDEFSNDELFTDLSDTAVPTEKAVANYVSRRLGHNGSIQLTGSARFDPGFMALDGSTKMEGNLNMNSKQIKNLLDPVDDNDATTKDYVVQATQAYDEFDDLRNITIHDRVGSGDEQKQVLVPTGYKRLTIEPTVGTIAPGDVLADGSSTATVIATESRFDYSLNKNVQIITYNLLTGAGFNTTLTPVYVTSPGTKAGNVLENPIDEFTNAKEDTASDINIAVNRSANDTTINLQIESQAIVNADVNDAAEIAQSKLNMNFATTAAAAPTGTDQQKQATLGLASFDEDDFTVTDGWVTLKANDVDFADLPTLATDTVIGRSATGSGDASAIPFSTVISEGGGLADGDFTSERPYWSNPPTNTVPNNPGQALIQTGTAGSGNYAYTTIAYDNTGNTIVKRDVNGKVHVGSLIVGASPNYEILTETGGTTITMKTPEQGTVFTSAGATKPTMQTSGNIRVGDIPNVNDSTFFAASTYATEESALASRWIYTNFIEAATEKDATGTGIGLGAGTGFNDGGADKITHVTGGAVRTITSDAGLQINGTLTLNTTTTGAIIYEGTANAFETILTFVDPTADRTITFPNAAGTLAVSAASGSTTQGTWNGAISAAGQISGTVHGLATSDSPSFSSINIGGGFGSTGATIASTGNISTDGTITMTSTSALTTRAITTGAAATTGTITGTWSLSTGSRFEATYADLAEYYEADIEYETGTVLVFGGNKEVTQSTEHRSTRVAGVVSENPAYVMNQGCPGIATPVALQGRVPVKVIGKVAKGDMLVASAISGYAVVDNDPKVGTVIGKAVGEKLDADKGMVEVVVGRV